MDHRRHALGVVLLGCVSLAPAASWAQQRYAFDAVVARIRADVIVTDENGRFVEGLGREDFVVFEDGKPQEILSVELVGVESGVDARGPAAAVAAATPTAGATPGVALTPIGGASPAAALVFVVDLPGMDWRNKTRFASAWEELLAGTDRFDTPRAVYMIDQVGRLHELAPLTFDVERVRAAASAVAAEPLSRKSQQELLVSAIPKRRPTLDASMEELARTRATLELLTQFCKALGARGGRTSLVWITSEVQITEEGPGTARALAMNTDAANSGALAGGQPWGPFMMDSATLRLQDELHRAANGANVSIYTLDPTPAYELHGVGFDVQTRTIAAAEALDSPLVQFSLEGLRDALKDAAAKTGGSAFIHWMEPADAVRSIEADASRFYVLTYANPPPIGDGRYHEIRVETTNRDLKVRERSGYTDYPTEQVADRLLSGALNLPGTVGGPPLAARALRKWSATCDPVVQLAVGIPDELAAAGTEFELHGLAVRDDGRIESTLEQRIREPSGADTLPVYVRPWDLPAGAYELHLVVRDTFGGMLRATTVPVDVPPATTGWAAGDVVLTIPDAAGRPIPLTGETLAEDQIVAAYVEVVFGQSPVISGDLFNAEGSEEIAALPPVALQAGSDGIFRGALRMTGIPAGDCILQVAVTDAAARKHQVSRMPIRVVARER